jgi:uncharacterized iron-regulated membrane protein
VLTLHLWAGLLASAFLLVLGLTGSLLVCERGIDHALNRRLFYVQLAPQPLPLGKLFSVLEKAHPGYHVTDMAFSRAAESLFGKGGEFRKLASTACTMFLR